VDGICVNASDTCAVGTADCDGVATTGPGGCEASLHDDDANCGSCAHACGAQERCRGGTCHPRCSRLSGDCQAPRTGASLATTCTYVGDGMQYRFTWGTNPAPVAIGDRIALRANAIDWACNWGLEYLDGYRVPCPIYFPPLTTRVVAP
jgi:hypothetical protein